jgi:hypothetical protein
VPQTDVPTVSKVVRRAVAICDPGGQDGAVVALFEAFEDDDRPAPGLGESLNEELRTSAEGIDEDGDDPAVHVAAAVAAFLATQPEGGSDDDATLREGARVMWGGSPPDAVRDWLAQRGVDL